MPVYRHKDTLLHGLSPMTSLLMIMTMAASALMLESMKAGNLNRQNRFEKRVTDLINATGVGPLGLGGSTTALGTFMKIGFLRASGVRIASMRPGCCFEPRKATVILES